MSFDMFKNDLVTISKPDGRIFENVRADVQSEQIFISDKNIPLENGDKIKRVLPSGVIEVYVVLDNGFFHGGNGLHGGYQAKVRKESSFL